MLTVDTPPRTPDLVGALAIRAERAHRLEAPELVDVIAAVLDRAELADVDERARLLRTRGKLEVLLASRLAE